MSRASTDKNIGVHSLSVTGKGHIEDLTANSLAVTQYDRILGTGTDQDGVSGGQNVVLDSPTITGSAFSTSDNITYTVSKAGVYAFNLRTDFYDSASLTNVSLTLTAGGKVWTDRFFVTQGTDSLYGQSLSATVLLAVGDTFKFSVYRNHAGNNKFPFVEVVRLS